MIKSSMTKVVHSPENASLPENVNINISFPEEFSNAYSDINAINAFIVRRCRELDIPICSIPKASAEICFESGIRFNGNAEQIMGIVYDYFKIKEREISK